MPALPFRVVVWENGDALDARGEPCGSSVMLLMHSGNGAAGDYVLTLRAATYRNAKDGVQEKQESARLLRGLDEELARLRRTTRLRLSNAGLRERPDTIFRFLEKDQGAAWSKTALRVAVEDAKRETERRLAAIWGAEFSIRDADPEFIAASEK